MFTTDNPVKELYDDMVKERDALIKACKRAMKVLVRINLKKAKRITEEELKETYIECYKAVNQAEEK